MSIRKINEAMEDPDNKIFALSVGMAALLYISIRQQQQIDAHRAIVQTLHEMLEGHIIHHG